MRKLTGLYGRKRVAGLGVEIRSVYDGRHHLLMYADDRVELYDVGADPAEKTDLSKQSPELVERLVGLLDD